MYFLDRTHASPHCLCVGKFNAVIPSLYAIYVSVAIDDIDLYPSILQMATDCRLGRKMSFFNFYQLCEHNNKQWDHSLEIFIKRACNEGGPTHTTRRFFNSRDLDCFNVIHQQVATFMHIQ